MLVLKSNSLGKRHHELNEKVNEAFSKRRRLDEIVPDSTSDVDQLFKIKLASKYKDIDYIFKTLKCGDSLHISHALKATWMFDEEYSHIISPNTIQDDLQPHMSEKMFKKFLTTLIIHVRDQKRAIAFYEYFKSKNRKELAQKILIFTPDYYKLELIKNELFSIDNEEKYLPYFIGNSFELAEQFLNQNWLISNTTVYILRYLYNEDAQRYLNLLEKHWKPNSAGTFGSRISKNIFLSYKERIIKHPKLYLKVLHHKTVLRHTTAQDAKVFIEALLIELKISNYNLNTQHEILSQFKNKRLREFVNKIPENERFKSVKSLFKKKYPGESFEKSIYFYEQQLYDIMTVAEKEEWALKLLASGEELLESGEDYNLYKFVTFDKAFDELKKVIRITPKENKRVEVLVVLAQTPKTMNELEKVLKYFIKSHMNEQKPNKIKFILAVLQNFNAYDFNEAVWADFNKVMHSLEVYNEKHLFDCYVNSFRTIVSEYLIINNTENIPKIITEHIKADINYKYLRTCINKRIPSKLSIIYEYILGLHLETVKNYENLQYNDTVRKELRTVLSRIIGLADTFGKCRISFPEIVQKFLELDSEFFNEKKTEHVDVTVGSLLRDLKENIEIFNEKFPDIQRQTANSTLKLNVILNKLRVYFNEDVSKQWLDLFVSMLDDPSVQYYQIFTAVNAVMILADPEYKTQFINNLAPEESIINHSNIDRDLLYKREAVCRFMGFSRPPVPIELLMKFLKGDYVHYCLPLFNIYGANLVPDERAKLIEDLLDKPLSIRKHGIRLAFQHCDINTLKGIITKIWNNTKNVSLRTILYKSLYEKLCASESNEENTELFELLKLITTQVNNDDDQEIFDCLTNRNGCHDLPYEFRLAYLKLSWEVINKLPDNKQKWKRKHNIIRCLTNHVADPNSGFIEDIIKDHIKKMLVERKIFISCSNEEEETFNSGVWELLNDYIITDGDLDTKLKFVEEVTSYFMLLRNTYKQDSNYRPVVVLFEMVLNSIGNSLYDDRKHLYGLVLEKISVIPLWERYPMTIKMRLKLLPSAEAVKDLHWEEAATHFGEDVGGLVTELVECKQYYPSLIDEFIENIKTIISDLNRFYEKDDKDVYFVITVVEALLKTDIFETYLLGLKLISSYGVKNVGTKVFEIIEKSKYDEVKALMYTLTCGLSYRRS